MVGQLLPQVAQGVALGADSGRVLLLLDRADLRGLGLYFRERIAGLAVPKKGTHPESGGSEDSALVDRRSEVLGTYQLACDRWRTGSGCAEGCRWCGRLNGPTEGSEVRTAGSNGMSFE
jgi:hypothetical protein